MRLRAFPPYCLPTTEGVADLVLVRPVVLRCLTVLAALLLAGCWTSDISRIRPFSASVGQSLTTKRAAFLYRNAVKESRPEWRKTLNLEEDALVRAGDQRRKEQEAFVPAGQSIRVTRVEKRVGDGIITYEAYGEVFVPSLHRFVEFRFRWGDDDTIIRAPWEDGRVAATRSIRSL